MRTFVDPLIDGQVASTRRAGRRKPPVSAPVAENLTKPGAYATWLAIHSPRTDFVDRPAPE
jgi:hypothetical protein